ncbi:MAG: hypothetical protein COB66_01710 [Coxiella sp. (in: Bacteria)]|nr:MAG: hypothetical protein COB66_01710 [Coxiella sp. (in: g-proteobacteria)]
MMEEETGTAEAALTRNKLVDQIEPQIFRLMTELVVACLHRYQEDGFNLLAEEQLDLENTENRYTTVEKSALKGIRFFKGMAQLNTLFTPYELDENSITTYGTSSMAQRDQERATIIGAAVAKRAALGNPLNITLESVLADPNSALGDLVSAVLTPAELQAAHVLFTRHARAQQCYGDSTIPLAFASEARACTDLGYAATDLDRRLYQPHVDQNRSSPYFISTEPANNEPTAFQQSAARDDSVTDSESDAAGDQEIAEATRVATCLQRYIINSIKLLGDAKPNRRALEAPDEFHPEDRSSTVAKFATLGGKYYEGLQALNRLFNIDGEHGQKRFDDGALRHEALMAAATGKENLLTTLSNPGSKEAAAFVAFNLNPKAIDISPASPVADDDVAATMRARVFHAPPNSDTKGEEQRASKQIKR